MGIYHIDKKIIYLMLSKLIIIIKELKNIDSIVFILNTLFLLISCSLPGYIFFTAAWLTWIVYSQEDFSLDKKSFARAGLSFGPTLKDLLEDIYFYTFILLNVLSF